MLSNSDKEAILAQCYANAPATSTRGGDEIVTGEGNAAVTDEGVIGGSGVSPVRIGGNMKYYGEVKREVTLCLSPALADHLAASGAEWEARLEDFLTAAYAAHRI